MGWQRAHPTVMIGILTQEAEGTRILTCSGPEVAAEVAAEVVPGVGKRCHRTWVGVEGQLQHLMAIHDRTVSGGAQEKLGRKVWIIAMSMISVIQIVVTTVMMMVVILTIEWVHRWHHQVRTTTCRTA